MKPLILWWCLLITAPLSFAAALDCWNEPPLTRKPQPGWESHTLIGMTRQQALKTLGCPPHYVRMTSPLGTLGERELWVYLPYDKDSTGLYLWLKAGVVHQSRLDTFSGFWTHEMDNPDFWN